MVQALKLAEGFHRQLRERILKYLRDVREFPDITIYRHFLGGNGKRIIIPIFDREGKYHFCKLAKDPEDQSDSPKMLSEVGSYAELYDWQTAIAKPK